MRFTDQYVIWFARTLNWTPTQVFAQPMRELKLIQMSYEGTRQE